MSFKNRFNCFANQKMVKGKNMNNEFNLIIIGAGPGGYVAAIRAAQLGAKVLLIEKEAAGGTCLNRGCIPTKALVASAGVYKTVKNADSYGVKAENVDYSFPQMQDRKNKIVLHLRAGVEQLLKSNAVTLIKGSASLLSKNEVEVSTQTGTETYKSEKIIIATGSVPAEIPSIPADGKKILTSDHILDVTNGLAEAPKTLMIIGAGVIGIEFACIFNALGTKVTVFEMLPKILPYEDEEVADKLKMFLVKDGIEIKTGTAVEPAMTENYELVLVAVGRKPNTSNLALEKAGVIAEKAFIKVNDKMETNISGIYAIGDAAGGVLLAHKASAEGIAAAENACGQDSKIDYSVIPSCVYAMPEVASTGLTQKKASALGLEVNIGRFPFSANGRAMTLGKTTGFIKVLADKKTDEVLGVHILGAEASEMIGEAVTAVKMKLKVNDFTRIMHAHPTMAEAILEAVHDTHKEAIDLPKKK